MQVERNFIELNYNAHFKGQTKKKEAHPVAGQDCIRTTRLHGVTNQTSTKRIFTNVKISDLIQKKSLPLLEPEDSIQREIWDSQSGNAADASLLGSDTVSLCE